jgi:hypothetical protein
MSEQCLQTLILAAIATVLLLQTIALAGIAKFIHRARKPIEALMAREHGFLEIAGRTVDRVDREPDKLRASLTSGPSKRHDGLGTVQEESNASAGTQCAYFSIP